MKQLLWLPATLLPLLLGLAGASCHSRNSTSITVSESANAFVVSATYPARQSQRVAQYVDASLQPDRLFGPTEELDQALVLHDHARLQVQAAPGTLRLTVDKDQTPPAALARFRRLGRGLGPLLTAPR